ncbi:beta-propeller domain-containing protein [Acidaminobacter hydrogenoformans]|uniref:Copper amine oxidase N-terminal domain-containing protein n=1 Tax=Acidaminobacter hydrogenoformans DSM 2784 TaxID=1120920 RepID=A0A1G5RTA7_9FIRM|nr:beta-propeller domain-containing protein [Acidaminobacter hydrogenoformans]SCZ77314.1 Copper amine oxidase N-terminal domain-containing protein [Acidaminobacter hydrogenoformans DSM 2784]
MKKILSILMLAVLAITAALPAMAETTAAGDGSIALYIGSPLTLSAGVIKPLDPDNPNVAAIVHKDRTLVPARAVAEHFGAEVSYDAQKQAAVIEFGGKQFIFYFNKNYYDLIQTDQPAKRVTFDTEALVIENRAMLPLRVICEDVLGKAVSYDSNVIVIGDKLVDLAANQTLRESIRAKIGQAVKVSSLWQLKTLLSNSINQYGAYGGLKEAVPETSAEAPAAEAPSPSAAEDSAAGAGRDYSTTNEQVAGIEEADLVKTDGKFIYVASGNVVSVVKADGRDMTLTDTIRMPVDTKTGQGIHISELYIDSGRLIILGSKNQPQPRPVDLPATMDDAVSEPAPAEPVTVDAENDLRIGIMPPYYSKSFVYTGVYTITDAGKAELLKEFELEGNLLSSRKKDDTVYLAVNKYNYYYIMEDVLPMLRDSAKSDDYKALSVSQVMYYPGNTTPEYLMVAAIDIRDKETPSTVEAILGSGTQIYMNDHALYIARQDYSDPSGTTTSLSKFSIDGLKIGFAGGGKVKGTLLNQFSMDEYEGHLRLATTRWAGETTSAVYVLDSQLNVVGKVENMAPGETIYSARFMGDKGYVVTFRQIDPLFVLDLSNPKAPRITGELKVPGFSNYLHPVEEDLILGIGQGTQDIYTRNQDGEEVVIGTRTAGIKFSLFDVSDMGKPKEIQTLTLGGSGSYAEMLYNHKAILFDLENQMFAFDGTISDEYEGEKNRVNYFNGAVIMNYDAQDGFDVKGRLESLPAMTYPQDGYYYSWVRRLCYIGDTLYYVQDGRIRAFDKETLAPLTTISIY